MLAGIAAVGYTGGPDKQIVFEATYVRDAMSDTLKIALMIIAIPVFIYGREGLRKQDEWRAVYLMLGLIWASAYSLIYIQDPASFDLDAPIEATDELSEIQTKGTGRLVYFSFVTMTTLGYGDVTPKSYAAANLAILQALTGQIYLAVILARIVSLLVTRPDLE